MRSLVLIALALTGCPQEHSGGDSAATSATASAAPTPAASSAAPLPTPPALDVEPLKKALRCSKDEGACGVLAAFHDCVAWSPATDSGDGRWLGQGFRVKDGVASEEVTMLRSKRVNITEVAAGQLFVKIGVEPFPVDRQEVLEQAQKALRAFGRRDVPHPANPAIRHVKERKDWPENFVQPSAQSQIYVQSDGGAWLCNLADQRLLLVHRSAGSAADGLYATYHPVSW